MNSLGHKKLREWVADNLPRSRANVRDGGAQLAVLLYGTKNKRGLCSRWLRGDGEPHIEARQLIMEKTDGYVQFGDWNKNRRSRSPKKYIRKPRSSRIRNNMLAGIEFDSAGLLT